VKVVGENGSSMASWGEEVKVEVESDSSMASFWVVVEVSDSNMA